MGVPAITNLECPHCPYDDTVPPKNGKKLGLNDLPLKGIDRPCGSKEC